MYDVPVSWWFGLFVGLLWDQTSYYISEYMCISRFVRLLLGSEQPSATGSLAVHQGLYGASFRVWLFVYLRVHLIAACGGQPKAAVQHIPVCSLWSCRIWRAAEGPLSVYPGFLFCFFVATCDGRPEAAFQYIHACS